MQCSTQSCCCQRIRNAFLCKVEAQLAGHKFLAQYAYTVASASACGNAVLLYAEANAEREAAAALQPNTTSAETCAETSAEREAAADTAAAALQPNAKEEKRQERKARVRLQHQACTTLHALHDMTHT